jgi:hypothetical protein
LSIAFASAAAGEVARRSREVKLAAGFIGPALLTECRALVFGGGMRIVASIGFACLALISCGAARAQTLEDMQRCRSISDEARRLACYDRIELTSAPRGKYEIVDLAELKGFALSFRGHLVEVKGWFEPGEERFFLGIDAADDQPMPVDVDSLPRRDLQAFRDACGDGCEATVQGRVRPVNFTTGIVADTLVAH